MSFDSTDTYHISNCWKLSQDYAELCKFELPCLEAKIWAPECGTFFMIHTLKCTSEVWHFLPSFGKAKVFKKSLLFDFYQTDSFEIKKSSFHKERFRSSLISLSSSVFFKPMKFAKLAKIFASNEPCKITELKVNGK